MDDSLIDYIQKEVWKGISKEEIKRALLKAGYKSDVIDFAFQQIEKGSLKKHAHLKFVSIILVIFIIIILSHLIFSNIYSAKNIDMLEETSTTREMTGDELVFYKQALETKDISLCEKAGQIREMCLAILTKDASKCEFVGEKSRDACFFDVAVETKDEKICDKAGAVSSNCYLILAKIKKDELLCEKALNMKDICIEVVGSVS